MFPARGKEPDPGIALVEQLSIFLNACSCFYRLVTVAANEIQRTGAAARTDIGLTLQQFVSIRVHSWLSLAAPMITLPYSLVIEATEDRATPLTDELRTRFSLGNTVRGVVVLEVDPASPAAERNVKVGDVIVEAAQEQVNSIEDVVQGIERMRTSGRNAVLLRLEDAKGDLRFVAVPVQ